MQAAKSSSNESHEALGTLCRAYWYPLYAFLRRLGKSPHDAEDLTQGFFFHLLQGNGLRSVRPDKGRFRSFLLASIKHFVADEREKAQAQKRGGGAGTISLDADQAEERYRSEAMEQLAPDRLFERRWAVTLLDRALGRLAAEMHASGKAERFNQLQIFLSGQPREPTYAEAARRLQMTEGAVKVAVMRMRQRYGDLVRMEISNTVATEAEVDEEMRCLIAALGE